MGYRILHGHGRYAPKGRKSYILIGKSFASKTSARKVIKEQGLDDSRIVPKSSIRKIKRGLVYVRR